MRPDSSPGAPVPPLAMLATGLALLVALALLETVAGDGGLALAAVSLLLLLGLGGARGASTTARPQPERARAQPLGRQLLLAATPALGAAAAVVVVARGVLPLSGPPGLATVARGVALLGATLLARTPPALLPLHALGVLMVLWTSAALEPELDPLRALVALSALVLLAQGLALGRSAEAQAEADLTAGVGQAERARRRAASPLPALLAAGLAALPAGLGLAIPRPMRGAAGAAAPTGSPRGASRAELVRFAPELRLDAPRGPLSEDDRVVARLTADPEPPTLYLRGAALPRLSEAGFFPAAGPEPEPRAGEEVPVLLTVSVEASQLGYLPLAGRVASWEGLTPSPLPGGFGPPPGTRYPLRYQARCLLPDPAQELRTYPARGEAAWLEVPPALREGPLRELAAQAVRGGSPAERAAGLVHWLQGRCRYDLRAGARGASAAARLEAFLIQDRRGVCTEFAAAMAVLLRLAGDPARVVTGWRVVERDQDDRRVIRERHAHAWVEVPLEGAGWIPFDPTPDPLPGADERDDPQAAPGDRAAAPTAAPPPLPPRARARPPSPLTLAGLALLLITLTGGGVARELARRRRWACELGGGRGVARAAWKGERELLFALLAARGFVPGRAETPREFLAKLPLPGGEREARARAALEEALELYTVLRFSGRADLELQAALAAALASARG